MAVEQLWVNSRPHLIEELGDNVQQLSNTLETISEENQLECLKRFWCEKDWFNEVGSGAEEDFKSKVEIYDKHLVKNLSHSISDKGKYFTGIPLQVRVLAEAFDKEFKEFYHLSDFVPDLLFKLKLLVLYDRFIERKYEISTSS
jgi:hypothetical protein